MDSTTRFISIAILVLALVTHLILTQAIRRRRNRVTLRVIPAYDHLPLMVGEAIESDRPVHLSFGSAAPGGTNTAYALADAEFFYHVAQRAATGTIPPVITMSDTLTIPLAQDTLRRAYASRQRMNAYSGGSIRWFPAGGQSLAFAAALTATLADDRAAANVLAGSFGAELALVLDAANRRDQSTVATSDRLDGQAVAYALSERPLLGEEVFSAGAYLDGSASQLATVVTTDVLRWLLVLLIILPTADALTDGAVVRLITRLLEGR